MFLINLPQLWQILFFSGFPCSVGVTGSHLIVNIVESRGDEISQEPDPAELPISGTEFNPGSHIGSRCYQSIVTLFNWWDNKVSSNMKKALTSTINSGKYHKDILNIY